jgi:PD-(D/E)XK nuclease superfamily
MTYSYTQISQYLSCQRRYRHRYLDGWQEKDTRAAMLFGRAFEQAVAALFRREDPAAVLFQQWGLSDVGLTYSGNDTWDRMLQQGIQLPERFAQDGRVRVRRPSANQQIQFLGSFSNSLLEAIRQTSLSRRG